MDARVEAASPARAMRKGWRFVSEESRRPTSPLVSLREAAGMRPAQVGGTSTGAGAAPALFRGKYKKPTQSARGEMTAAWPDESPSSAAAARRTSGVAGGRVKTGYTPPKNSGGSGGRTRHMRVVAQNRGQLTARLRARQTSTNALSASTTQLSSHSSSSSDGRTTSSLAPPATTADKHTPVKTPTPSHVFSKATKKRAARPRPATASVSGRRAPSLSSSSSKPFNDFLARAHSVRRDVANSASSTSSVLSASRRTDPLLCIMTQKQGKRENLAESLLIAAEAGNAVKVDQLLMQGAPTNACGRKGLDGFTALHYASSRGHIAVAERLVRAGNADLEPTNKDGEVPLHLAAYGGHLTIVELLLDSGAEVDVGNGYGETPLFYAARRGFAAVVRLLLQRGADVSKTSRFGDTAIDDCESERIKKIIALASEGDEAGAVQGYGSGRLGLLPTRMLEHVFSMLDAPALGMAARVDGRCHRVAESKDLWSALGVARWELAVRARVREQSGGFSVAPLLATYRPSSIVSAGGNGKSGKSRPRPKSARQVSLSDGIDSRSAALNGGNWTRQTTTGADGLPSGREGQAPESPQRTALGLTMDVFLSDDETESNFE